jgi:DNA-binding response OmpR family regulator
MAAKILIADDDRDLVQVLTMRCESVGLEVIAAYDGFTAISLAHEHHPDLFCLDADMPSGGGLCVCEMLSSDASFANVPVIILTGKTQPEIVRRCWDLCAYYVLKSPDTWNRLVPLLDELLLKPAERSQ